MLLSKPTADSSEMTVFAQMKLKSFGLPLRQCHNGTQDDVLLCLRSNRTVQLQEENGILVMQRHRRLLATELAGMKNIKLLVQDLAVNVQSLRRMASLDTLRPTWPSSQQGHVALRDD